MKFGGMIGYYPGTVWLDFGIDRVKGQGQGHEKAKMWLRRRYALHRVPVLVYVHAKNKQAANKLTASIAHIYQMCRAADVYTWTWTTHLYVPNYKKQPDVFVKGEKLTAVQTDMSFLAYVELDTELLISLRRPRVNTHVSQLSERR